MILALGRGRAGNLMFQLGGISALRANPDEKLVLVNFLKLRQIFPSLQQQAFLFETPERHARWAIYLEKTLKLLASLRVVGSVRETYPDSTVLVRKRGFFPLTLFEGGWCQSESAISTTLLRRLYEESLPESVKNPTNAILVGQKRICFVHIRRGDYLIYPSPEHPAALPPCWYREQISRITTKHPGILIRFYSDDMEYAKREFRDVENSEFVEASASEAFFQMSLADDGILSPSTYSWWAAYFAHSRTGGTFVAPHFWTGWSLNRWYPYKQIRASFLKYEKVDCARVLN